MQITSTRIVTGCFQCCERSCPISGLIFLSGLELLECLFIFPSGPLCTPPPSAPEGRHLHPLPDPGAVGIVWGVPGM